MPALDQYFRAMVAQGASDFHLSSGNYPTFRIAGTITAVGKEILTADAVEKLIYEIIPERNRLEWEQTHDTDFAYELTARAVSAAMCLPTATASERYFV